MRWVLSVPVTLPQMLAVVSLAILGSSSAGFAPTRWYPSAVFLAALLTMCAFALPRRTAVPRSVLVALGAMAGLTAWSFLSVLWADDPGAAWTGSNRTLLFLIVLALFALWRQRGRHAVLVIGAWTAWTIGLAAAALIQLDAATNLEPLFIGDRLSSVAGYPNGTAAALMLGFFPALVIAGRREVPWWLRGLFAGGAVICVDVALLAQSRGSLYSTPIVLLLLFAAVPGRLRTLAVLGAVGVGVALTAPGTLSDLDQATAGDGLRANGFDGIGVLVAIGAAATTVMVALGAIVDARTDVPADVARRARRVVGTVALTAAVIAAVAVVAVAGDPFGRASRAWDSFKGGYTEQQAQGNRLTSGLGSGRYDFYRVSMNQLSASPALGAGADNFLEDYLQTRRTGETPRYPHSVVFRTLGQLGLVGAALLLALLGAAAFAVWRALRQADDMAGAVAGAAAIVFVYWFVHGSFDWFWEYGGLGASAFAMLGLALALVPRGADRPDARPFAAGRRGLVAIPVLAVVAYTLVAPWLAERWIDEASGTWARSPGEAFDLLDRAAAANPLSSRPYLVGGVIAVRVDDLPLARTEFRRALQREPRSYYAALELGAIASEFGRRAVALAWLERARRASPRDPIVRRAIARVRAGGQVTAAEINAAILKRARGLVS